MDPELQEKLFEKYPHLLRGRNESIQSNLLPFGIATEDGWYDLLDDLLSDLKKIDPNLKVTQIKEKFGLLRVYCRGTTKEAFDRIQEAEDQSAKICERCGSTENVEHKAPNNWWRTLCEDCWEKQLKEKKKKRLNAINKHGETD